MFGFKYAVADWVKEYGLPQHHLRIIDHRVVHDGFQLVRQYLIFDTTLRRGHADYEWVAADRLEANSELVEHTDDLVKMHEILTMCQRCRYVRYSILKRLDCESLQRYIQTLDEAQRYSQQVRGWATVGAIGFLVVLFSNGGDSFAA